MADEEALAAVEAARQLWLRKKQTHSYLTADGEQIVMNAALHLAVKALLDQRALPDYLFHEEQSLVNYFVARARTAEPS